MPFPRRQSALCLQKAYSLGYYAASSVKRNHVISGKFLCVKWAAYIRMHLLQFSDRGETITNDIMLQVPIVFGSYNSLLPTWPITQLWFL